MLAIENTKYDKDGRAVLSEDDEWVKETKWDDLFSQIKKEKGFK